MEKIIGYDVKALIEKLFPSYVLKQIHTEHNSEEHYREERAWYLAYPELNRVRFYHSDFTDSQTLYSDEGEEMKAYSSNMNADDTSLLRINKLKEISPILTMIDETYAEINEELNNWIELYCEVAETKEYIKDTLQSISKTFCIDRKITFKGCCTPSRLGNSWSYSNKPLTLHTSEINIVLNSIEDELLRKKIECIFNDYGTKYKGGRN